MTIVESDQQFIEVEEVLVHEICQGSMTEAELVDRISRRMHAYKQTVRYALLSLDTVEDQDGFVRLANPL